MKPEDVFDVLCRRSLPVIKAFKNDLLVHDFNAIKAHPGTPFLHFTGVTGTNIVMLVGPDEFPKRGEIIPYLFGTARRERILDGMVSLVDSMRFCNRSALIQLYTGTTVKTISLEEAKEEIACYRNYIYSEWLGLTKGGEKQ